MERPGRLLEPRNLPTDGTKSLCIFLDSSRNVPTDQQISRSWLVQRVGSSFAYHDKFRLHHKAGAILAAVCQINLRPGTVSQAHQQGRRSDFAVQYTNGR